MEFELPAQTHAMGVTAQESTVQITSRFERRKQCIAQWQKFLSHCLARRLDPAKFEEFVPIHYSRHPLPPGIIADLLLRPQPRSRDYLDPRIPRYVQALVQLKQIDTSSILKALYKYSTSHSQAGVFAASWTWSSAATVSPSTAASVVDRA